MVERKYKTTDGEEFAIRYKDLEAVWNSEMIMDVLHETKGDVDDFTLMALSKARNLTEHIDYTRVTADIFKELYNSK